MSERPILMSAPMVRALLAGTKTQTRRMLKRTVEGSPYRSDWVKLPGTEIRTPPYPYGRPGDRLWVREAFMHEPADYCWEASVSIPCRPAVTAYRADHDERESRGAGWKPSIHMPRALSRITLEITGVRVERLQSISEADAIAEGIDRRGPGWAWYSDKKAYTMNPVTSYRDLWESINGPGSWDANPWVWVIEFRRLEQPS